MSYVVNNPLIYWDPTGHWPEWLDNLGAMWWDGAKDIGQDLYNAGEWVGMRTVGLVHGTIELGVDAAVGLGTIAWNAGQTIGSAIGYSGTYYAHELGLISNDTYNYRSEAYMDKFTTNGQALINLPSNMVTGIVDNFKTTFNADNFINYLTTDNYNEIKDYSKSAVQTGATIYGGYQLGKAVVNKVGTAINNYKFTHQKIDVNNLKYSNTILDNPDYYVNQRPYMKSNMVIDEIMKSKTPIIDPLAPDALKWNVSGSLGKTGGYTVGIDQAYTVGNWELIVNPTTNTIYHFNFKGLK